MHSKCRQLTFVSTKTVPVVIFRLFIYLIRRLFNSPMFRYALNNTSGWLTVFAIFFVVTQVFHAMHSLLTHPLAIYAVVFDIRKLLNPATREQVGGVPRSDGQLHTLVAVWSCGSTSKFTPWLHFVCLNVYRCKSQ